MGFTLNIVSMVNSLVAQQRAEAFNSLEDTMLVVPFFLRYYIKFRENAFFLDSTQPFEFSTDLTDWISWRSTVTFLNMQRAYYLGFSEVYLIGVDHSYIQPEKGEEGALIKSNGDDSNHFNKTYFGKCIVWQKVDTESMERVYWLAKEAFERDERKIYNVTAGRKLELFDRADYETLFPCTVRLSIK